MNDKPIIITGKDIQDCIDRWEGKPPLKDGLIILAMLISAAVCLFFMGYWQ